MHSILLALTIVAHGAGFNTSLANHLQRWLKDELVKAQVVPVSRMAPSLAKERLAFLVGFESPTAAELEVLRAFRARGGKLVVFHSGSPALAALMGVKPLGFRAAAYPGQWSRMDFVPQALTGTPTAIRQTSSVLHRVRPLPGRGRVIATWSDRAGRATGDAAWIATDAGYWMSHVLLADGDENLKAQLLGALVASVQPSLWSVAAHQARERAQMASFRRYAEQQSPRRGEIHAVWDHSGCGLYPGNWPRTMRLLRDSGVTDLFVNVAGAGFAHYSSRVLPRSATCQREGDQLAACLAAAKGMGVRIHAWIVCFSGTRGSPEVQKSFAARGWRLRDRRGQLTEYLDPSVPSVRNRMLSAMDELQANYGVHGIHLDFVRWGDNTVRPANAAEVITRFVVEARSHVRRPRWLTAAVYGRYPNCVASVGQDWTSWVDARLVDYVVPMNYSEDLATYRALISQQAAVRARAAHTIAGIGVTANESRLNARQVIDQINSARAGNLAGVALFDLDVTLERQILPYLRLGIWK